MDDDVRPILLHDNILDIDGGIIIQIEDILDEGKKWRDLLKVIPDFYSDSSLARKLECFINYPSTPAKELLIHLGYQGVTVGMMVKWFEDIRLERALLLLKPDECLEIIEQPVPVVEKKEGECLILFCRAQGYPTPHYQWFKGEKELITCQSAKLEKFPVTLDDDGLYVCRVHTWNRRTGEVQWLFSSDAKVIVNPQQLLYNSVLTQQQVPINITELIESFSIDSGNSTIKEIIKSKPKYLTEKCEDLFHPQKTIPKCTTPEPNINHILSEPQKQELSGPIIIKQPISPTKGKITQGSSVVLHCEGRSHSPVKYQWYKNGLAMKGETNPDIKLVNLLPDPDTGENKWYFHCCLHNDCGYVFTNSVEIELDISCEVTQYFAEDKVALLIANDTYDSPNMGDLRVPASDVETMSKLLLTLEFKVLAFRNLNKREMLKAVDLFCRFLRKGVYGFFYYVGHGFEQYGQCYLQPVDCTLYVPEECLCAQYVLQRMQERNPALCIVLLDACRVLPPQYKQGKPLTPGKIFEPKMSRNTVIGYATSFLCDSLEADGAKNGFFVTYLQKFLLQKRKIQDILFAVQQEFEKDKLIRNHQHPWIGSSLCSSMTLADPIKGNDSTFKELEEEWQHLTSPPSDIILPVPSKNIAIVLHFDKTKNTFCNCLNILVKLRSLNGDLTSLHEYDATINFPQDVVESEISQAHLRTEAEKACCVFDVYHLQRLQDKSLIGEVYLSHRKTVLGCISLNFGHPFVSQFDYFQDCSF